MSRLFFAGAAAAAALSAAGGCLADEYHVGQGLPVGDFLFSGYFNGVLEAPHGQPKQLSVDDLSLFVSGRVSRWLNPFLEAEISGYTVAQEGGGADSRIHLVPERLYNDSQIGAADTLRIGKILSPVGDWNLIHAAPLVPTITRPLTTRAGFAEYASGLSWLHSAPAGGALEWQLYVQPGDEWFPRPDNLAPRRFSDVRGAHVGWQLGLLDRVGLSLQQGRENRSGSDYTLLGANARRTFGRLTLESEATTARWSGGRPAAHDYEAGLYGLADYAVTWRWHGLIEWEHFQARDTARASENWLAGVAYKPDPALVWKLEYVDQRGESRDVTSGLRLAFSALF